MKLPNDIVLHIFKFYHPFRNYFSSKVLLELNWIFVKCYFCNRHVVINVDSFNREYTSIVTPSEILFHIHNKNYVNLKKVTINLWGIHG